MVFALIAQLDSALAYEARGSGFESRLGHVAAVMLPDGQAEDRQLRPVECRRPERDCGVRLPALPAERPGIGRENKYYAPPST